MIRLLKLVPVFLLVALVAWPGYPKQNQEKVSTTKSDGRFRIGFIKDRNLVEGCGCGFSVPNEMRKKFPRFILTSNIEDMNKAWMNIDGKDIELLMTDMTYPKGREKVGIRSTQRFSGPGIKVSAVLFATRVCARDDEGCESTDYSGTFRISKGRLQRTIKLTGACGC